jgi:uncharacterized coiled-coil protein SlyX
MPADTATTNLLIKILLGGMTVLAGVVGALWRRDAVRSDKCEGRVTALETSLAEAHKKIDALNDQRVKEAKEMLVEGLKALDRNSERLESQERALQLLKEATEMALERLSRP